MSLVVDNILSITLNEGHLDLEISPCSMEDMITEVLHSLENQAHFQRIRMSIKPPVEPDFPRQLLTDRRQFKGTIYRLLDNAIKYSDEGGEVAISLELEHREQDVRVVIRIMDEGFGITDTANIWQPFSSDNGSISRTSSGLGAFRLARRSLFSWQTLKFALFRSGSHIRLESSASIGRRDRSHSAQGEGHPLLCLLPTSVTTIGR